jgi:predicted O-methyltransferase YrrM
MASATGMVLFWYSVGWLRSSILYWLQSMKIINIIKKIGIKGVILELLRRMYLRVDFFCYPYLIYHLTHDTFSTTDQLCDFSYRKSLRLLIPGQVESEIRSFLDSARNIQPKNIVEIGTAHGGNLFLLTKIAQDGGKIISIDLPNGDYGGGYFSRKQKVYKKFVSGSQQMFLVRDDSHKPTTLDQVREILSEQMIDLLFIDADHSYEGVKADFEMYSPLVRPGGIVAFHDIANDPNPTYGVHKFWGEIKNKYHHQEIIDDQNRIGYGIGVVFL